MPKAWIAADKKAGMTVKEVREFIVGLPEETHLKGVLSIKGRLQELKTVEEEKPSE